jgi:hypothetical protein
LQLTCRDWKKNRAKFKLPVLPFEHYTELIDSLLCFPATHKCRAQPQECFNCGVNQLDDILLAAEKGDTDFLYEWDVFEDDENGHLTIKTKQGSPSEMAVYMKQIFSGFAYHRFIVKHQEGQCRLLAEHLPFHFVLLIRDYAEKFRMLEKIEIQT